MNPEIVQLIDRHINLIESNREIQTRIINNNAIQEYNLNNIIRLLLDDTFTTPNSMNPHPHVRAPMRAPIRTPMRSTRSGRNNSMLGRNILGTIINLTQGNPDFQDVIIRPTPEQISQATRSITFSEIENPPNARCPITQEDFQPTDEVTQIIHCQHCFSQSGATRLWNETVRCPLCRYDIREASRESNESTNTSETEARPPPPASNPNPNNQLNELISNVFNGNLENGASNDYTELTTSLLNLVNNASNRNNGSFDLVFTTR